MNLVGKIFVVLIMLMSVMFAAFAVTVYSTHQNWRDKVLMKPEDVKGVGDTVGLVYQLQDETNRYNEMFAEKERLEKELAALRAAKVQQIAKLEAERIRLSQERDEITANYATLVTTREENIEDVRLAQKNLSRLGEQIDGMRVAITDARVMIDTQFASGELKTEEVHQLLGQLRLIEERNKELVTETAKAKEQLKGAGGPSAAPASRVEGFVTAVSNEKKLAEISIGSDDGVKEGNELEVFREGNYVGQLVVVKTTSDRAVGKIARLVRPMNRGDKVSSRSKLNLAVAP